MLRHSISLRAQRDFYPDDLFFMVKNWLVHRSRNSDLTENHFNILRKERDIEIKCGDENVKFLKYNENGLSFASCDYRIKRKEGIYFTAIHVLRTLEGTFISGRLDTFSDGDRNPSIGNKNIPASVPSIFKTLFRKARGGMNGTLPLLMSPLRLEYEQVMSAYSDPKRPLLLPVVCFKDPISGEIDLKSLARNLFGKASVVSINRTSGEEGGNTESVLHESDKKKKFFLSFRKRSTLPGLEIFFPDGDRIRIKADNVNTLEKRVVETITGSQSRQYSPIDYRYIADRKEKLKTLNYRCPNFNCRMAFEILASLPPKERDKIEESLSIKNGINFENNLKAALDKIILFESDKHIINELHTIELRKMLGIIKSGEKK